MVLRAEETSVPASCKVGAAAQGRRGLANIDRHLLPPPGAKLPQFRGRESAGSDSGRTGRADAERCRQHRIGTAGESDFRCLRVTPAGDRENRPKRFIRHGHDLCHRGPWRSLCTGRGTHPPRGSAQGRISAALQPRGRLGIPRVTSARRWRGDFPAYVSRSSLRGRRVDDHRTHSLSRNGALAGRVRIGRRQPRFEEVRER